MVGMYAVGTMKPVLQLTSTQRWYTTAENYSRLRLIHKPLIKQMTAMSMVTPSALTENQTVASNFSDDYWFRLEDMKDTGRRENRKLTMHQTNNQIVDKQTTDTSFIGVPFC